MTQLLICLESLHRKNEIEFFVIFLIHSWSLIAVFATLRNDEESLK